MRNITESEIKELERLKMYFPYRHVFGVVDKNTNQFSAYACKTKHQANKKTREGHYVAFLTYEENS